MPTMHSQNRNTLILWLALSCAALLVACGGGGSHKDARVRLLNASADLSSADLFVENGKVHELDGGTWAFGGPKSSQQVIDEIVGAVTS